MDLLSGPILPYPKVIRRSELGMVSGDPVDKTGPGDGWAGDRAVSDVALYRIRERSELSGRWGEGA